MCPSSCLNRPGDCPIESVNLWLKCASGRLEDCIFVQTPKSLTMAAGIPVSCIRVGAALAGGSGRSWDIE